MSSKPFLSVVVVGRNDNYGGDFTQRLQNCITWNTKFLEQNKIDTEFILVNWNPVEENKPLSDEIDWPKKRNHVNYRILTVSSDLHKTFINPEIRDTVPLFEFIAKNVGIRRATGEYLLLINGDILIHPKIFESINSAFLKEKTYYRVDRLDYESTNDLSVENLYEKGFMLFKKGFYYQLKSWLDKKKQIKRLDKINRWKVDWNLWKFKHEAILKYLMFTIDYNNGGFQAHCQASGDFMLMKRAHWLEMKGYPEYTSISTHTDSLFTILAKARFNEVVFDVPVFHQAHERRYGWGDIQKQNEKFAKAYRFFEGVAIVVRENRPIEEFLNDDEWGLADIQIPEKSF